VIFYCVDAHFESLPSFFESVAAPFADTEIIVDTVKNGIRELDMISLDGIQFSRKYTTYFIGDIELLCRGKSSQAVSLPFERDREGPICSDCTATNAQAFREI
jgi:hypothetical protein